MTIAMTILLGSSVKLLRPNTLDFTNTYTIDSHALWGLRAGYTTARWEVYAELRNAGDRKHVSYFSVRDVAAGNAAILNPGEPRSLFVGTRLRF